MGKLAGFGMVLLGAGAGVVSSAVLYFVVVGLLSLATGSVQEPGTPSLSSRSIEFGIVFGLLSGAHWTLGAARRLAPDALPVAKVIGVAMAALAIGLALTGARWGSMFGGLGGRGLVLVVAWLALTHVISKALERTPSRTSAGTA